jgi:glycosyltransferase involved in cell wall biosynthesis
MRRELDDLRPDVVHVMLRHALVLVATLPRRPWERRLLTHVYGEGIRKARYGQVREAVDRWAGARFDRVVGISRSVQQYLISSHGYPPSKVDCIPLGWEGTPLPPSREPRPPTVVCVAKFRPEKGHDVLLDAFAIVRREVPDARLVLVGQGELQERLRARIHALDLAGSVEITGPVDDVWPYLADADVFALASSSEAYGIAIAEAMAAGLPVVASDVGGIPELVVPGVSGELFAPGDAPALAAHLTRLLTSPDLRRRMSTAARAAAEPLRLSNTLPRYVHVCEELVQQRPAGLEGR